MGKPKIFFEKTRKNKAWGVRASVTRHYSSAKDYSGEKGIIDGLIVFD